MAPYLSPTEERETRVAVRSNCVEIIRDKAIRSMNSLMLIFASMQRLLLRVMMRPFGLMSHDASGSGQFIVKVTAMDSKSSRFATQDRIRKVFELAESHFASIWNAIFALERLFHIATEPTLVTENAF